MTRLWASEILAKKTTEMTRPRTLEKEPDSEWNPSSSRWERLSLARLASLLRCKNLIKQTSEKQTLKVLAYWQHSGGMENFWQLKIFTEPYLQTQKRPGEQACVWSDAKRHLINSGLYISNGVIKPGLMKLFLDAKLHSVVGGGVKFPVRSRQQLWLLQQTGLLLMFKISYLIYFKYCNLNTVRSSTQSKKHGQCLSVTWSFNCTPYLYRVCLKVSVVNNSEWTRGILNTRMSRNPDYKH